MMHGLNFDVQTVWARDFGLVESLRSINYNGQNSLNLKLYLTYRETKRGLKKPFYQLQGWCSRPVRIGLC